MPSTRRCSGLCGGTWVTSSNIPVANLTKENVREELHKRGVSVEESQRFTSIITKCDEAQYSPAASAQMSEVYAEGVDIISRIEAVIKR